MPSGLQAINRERGDRMKLGIIESQFAEIIWGNEPLPSGELVKLCAETLKWKKSTTYTVLRKLCNRGIFQNKNGMVCALISKEELHAMQSEEFVKENFDGSLPAFLAAFVSRQKLTQEEVSELQKLINENRR